MSLNDHQQEDAPSFFSAAKDEETSLSHRRLVKKRLEDLLEEKRLKKECSDFDDEFDWE
tara:strand:+ start:424 stop:600 length:177 start_codon:yes stop_codon:yes gene_type:complete